MHRIKINGELFFAQDGEKLSDVLIKSGADTEHPCAGRGICKKCIVIVNGKEELSCRYEVKTDITVELLHVGDIVSPAGTEESGKITENLCFVLDIGTTTMALALVSLDEKRVVSVRTGANPQRVFGSDVISRIDYCRKNGVTELNSVLISEINRMIDGFGLQHTKTLYVAGNTTMLHLFFGVDCTSIGTAPYTPVFIESRCVNAQELGIKGVEEVVSLPSVSSFAGADIVAGVNYVGMPAGNKYNLLVDLGTNAEIVLFSREKLLCTSAAAGPCFEGANISCGMSATDGAVYAYAPFQIKTVGNMPAKGICGTGLIDIIAFLLGNGEIDESGYMENGEFEAVDGIYLTQADIRQYQLAKSAVFSAVLTLIKLQNITFDDVENVYISGGFSAEINIENAVKTGLLPEKCADKCTAINNSSLLGAVKFALENNDLSQYLQNAEYVDLSSDAVFSQLFIENMMF